MASARALAGSRAWFWRRSAEGPGGHGRGSGLVVRGLDAEEHAWSIEVEGRFVGTVRLHSFVPADERASVAISIFDATLLGRGYGTEALQLLVRHAFSGLGLHRLSVRVLASNARAVRCYEKCGFRHEGRERESARVGHGWEDDFIMGLVRPSEDHGPAQ